MNDFWNYCFETLASVLQSKQKKLSKWALDGKTDVYTIFLNILLNHAYTNAINPELTSISLLLDKLLLSFYFTRVLHKNNSVEPVFNTILSTKVESLNQNNYNKKKAFDIGVNMICEKIK